MTISTGKPIALVMFLHGVGSSGADLAGLAASFGRTLPEAVFASPNAPEPSSFGAGYQWFSIAGVTETNRAGRIEAARAGFDAVVTAEIAAADFADRLDRVVFLGFSQGSIMALDALATGRWPIAGTVAFAGRLATPDPLTPPPGSRALLIHGANDPVIPASETTSAAARLRAAGVTIETEIVPGVGHTIAPVSLPLASDFLAKVLPA
jgi:phospholipase/carboxylesterase